MTEVVVRPRRAGDIPALAEVLLAQQASSRYPFREPLPIPVSRFLHAEDASGAWTAEIDGRPVGHACWVEPPSAFPDAEAMNRACAEAHGCEIDQLAWLSAVFVGLDERGTGVGRRLLETTVADIRARGRFPCLEVLPVLPTALRMYEATGWREVLRLRPEWLAQADTDGAWQVRVMALVASGSPD